MQPTADEKTCVIGTKESSTRWPGCKPCQTKTRMDEGRGRQKCWVMAAG
jgi:hypothetical protein